MAEFLLEILSEEIPARMQHRAAESLRDLLVKHLQEQRVEVRSSQFHSTPRRLVVVLDGLPEKQPDLNEERKGPAVGAPDKAVEGFARSAGVAVEDLEERESAKGPAWFAATRRKGRPVADLLAEALPHVMADLAWPRSMRWGGHDVRWVRPVTSIAALLGGKVVPFEFGPVSSGAVTHGHRFMSPGPIEVADFGDYRDRLRAAHVLIDRDERRALIARDAADLARAEGLVPDDRPALLDEVAGLVEWPVVMIGSFDPAFMEMPRDVLVSEMVRHQRHVPLRDPAGELASRFIVVANTEGRDEGRTIVAGNERVLAARLADGRHFWDQDRRRTLESRVGDLAGMVFHARLGTVAERAARMELLAGRLAASVPGCDPVLARRAARLAKADLTSQMVTEFPELQGVMGAHYARHDGEDEAVATAIGEHYSPLGPSDVCPARPVSVAVALADKIDTLVGFFAIDEQPTGSRDPFALRRAALGVVRLVLDNALRLSLTDMFRAAHEAYGAHAAERSGDALGAELLDFFAERLKVHLREQGIGHDLIDAVFSHRGDDDLVRLVARVRALASFLETEDGANLLAAYRRAANIVRIEEKRDGTRFDAAVDEGRLVEDREREVAAALREADAAAGRALDGERFDAAMAALAALRRPVDAFFDHVTVNAEDAALRSNRLGLLSAVRATMDRVADFSRMEG